jgi:RNA 3'-terminal phosphate cyclase-like protein
MLELMLMLTRFPKIKKRGSPPLGGGEVLFLCPIVKQVKTLNFVEFGKIKRIRGIAYATSLPNYSYSSKNFL